MKFSAAALVLLVSTPVANAFVPRSFGVSRSAIIRRATIEDDIDLVTSTIKNSVSREELNEIVIASQDEPQFASQDEPQFETVSADEARASAAAYVAQYEKQSGAGAIYSKLQENGVTVVNGFSGGAVLPLLDQFHQDHPRHAQSDIPPIRWITNSNESSAGHIAEGYAKSQPLDSEHLPVGVVVATSGPGVTNLITPLQDAICDGVPLVFLCGQAATVAPKDAFQACPAVELTKPCTKWSYQIKSAAEVPFVMDYAFYIARNGRPGPVFIDLPKDLQNQIITPELVDSFINTNLFENADQNAFARIVQRHRPNGDVFHAVHLGTDGKGLTFEVTKDANAGYKVVPVTQASSSDLHNADHHPSNQILRHETVTNGTGEEKFVTWDGDLAVNSQMTREMLKMIKNAKKPIIIAGQGCNDSSEELKKFAERLQIPVCTTLHGLGCFDERNPLALNMLGMHGHPTPNFMVQESDLVLCIGSRFDDRITGRLGSFIPQARQAAKEGRGGVIHVDVRLTEMAKQVRPTYFVHSTAKRFLQTLNEALEGDNELKPQTAAWVAHMKQLQTDFPVKVPHFPTEMVDVPDVNGGKLTIPRTIMSAQSVVTELNKQLVSAGIIDNAIFTTGVGIHQMVTAQLITWTQPRQMLSSGSLGTMGVALGYSIGAKLANEKKIVIAVDGDGSFNMTFTELKTLAEQNIPVKIMILDNEGQYMVEYWQRLFHENRLLAVRNSANPDYSILASAFGLKSLYCDCQEDLPEKMNQFLFDYDDEPIIFHVRIQATPCLPMVAPGQPLDDMIMEDVEIDVEGVAAPS